MGQESGLVVLGRVGAPFGVKGWVHVQSFTQPPANLLQYKTWHLNFKAGWQEMNVIDARPHGKAFAAKLKDIDSREAAISLTNLNIAVPRSALPRLPQGEYYWADLIGLTVTTEFGDILGKVDSLFETGANDVVVVKGAGGEEYLIPYVPGEYILDIALDKHIMQVHWKPEL